MLYMLYDYPGNILISDGVFARQNKDQMNLMIHCHDCMGVIVIGQQFYGIVHMSWKNLYLGVIDQMFKIFYQESLDTTQLHFILSPHITEKNMEVQFKHLWENTVYASECFHQREGKEYFSMEKFFRTVTSQKYNILAEQICTIPIDTYDNVNYASYRRNGKESILTNYIMVGIE
jgi:copper oxidase (laccase) domain-containing protein